MKKTIFAAALVLSTLLLGCVPNRPAQSVSGVAMAKVGQMETDSENHTVEQHNIIERIKRDNELGAIKHLYVISAYSGQAILYSPVKGKVTSGGKKLTPKEIRGVAETVNFMPTVRVGNIDYTVTELPNEDGTYGSSAGDYLYWFSPSGQYHQHYLSGGQIVHISDHPVAVKNVTINLAAESEAKN